MVLDVSELEVRQHGGGRLVLPCQYDGGPEEQQDDGAGLEAGSEPVRGAVEVVEAVEDRVSGQQPCDGVEEEEEEPELHGEPGSGLGEVRLLLQADPGILQQHVHPAGPPVGAEYRY